jgi:biopolymer transport protein ExbB/TolQ
MKMASDLAQALLGPLYWLRLLIVSKVPTGSGFTMQRHTFVAIAIGSAIWGTILYFALVLGTYQRLIRHVADHAKPPSLEQMELKQASEVTSEVTKASEPVASVSRPPVSSAVRQPTVAEVDVATQIMKDSSQPYTDQALAIATCAVHTGAAVRTEAVAVAQRMNLAAEGKDPYCDTRTQCDGNVRCSEDVRLAAAHLLVGSLGCGKQDPKTLLDPSNACHPWPIGLEPAWRPVRLALSMGCKFGDDESLCAPVAHLLQGALDDTRTRSLQVQFGMVYGAGRWLVIMLALAVASTLCWRNLMLRRMRLHIATLDEKLSPSVTPRSARATAVITALYLPKEPPVDAPSAGEDPVFALAYQANYSHQLQDATVVKDAANQASREMGRWWDLMGTFITLFPVIGLAATLNGLIHAFAQADQIAIALGDDRAGAIRAMVSELSSSFSTTFIALLAMAILTLWAMRLRHAEERDFDSMVERVDTYLSWRSA